ncbi:hypothetical protein M405DRAFT_811493 [Rhizopogon salebrosus TDB-379]|nr:hypothetical protein M405DRAFT_811493 [Rhizopogon salebrosus TDB-379]
MLSLAATLGLCIVSSLMFVFRCIVLCYLELEFSRLSLTHRHCLSQRFRSMMLSDASSQLDLYVSGFSQL